MCALIEIRWSRYAKRVESGEITAENFAYRPRGPMPSRSKAVRDLARWERQLANAQLVRFALEGKKLPGREIRKLSEKVIVTKKKRPHLRFGGKPPKEWHSVRYGTLIEKAVKRIRERLSEIGIEHRVS
jgi:hypothetical protein